MGTWNWLDWILAAVVVVSVVAAIMKGFVRELISLASVLAGLVIAALGYQRAALWFDDLTRSHNVALGLGFLVLFVGTLLVGALVSGLARKLIQKAGLQSFDRFLGGVFGPSSRPTRRRPGTEEQGCRNFATGSPTVKDHLEALVTQMIEHDIGYEDAVAEFAGRFIRKVLEKNKGNQSKAAKTLGIHRNTLSRKIEDLGLDHQPKRRKRARR
ncbi:MAG: CvpA family protein [Armatimonadetes bacterium]|nr:CvpA family protein [Armatimonadota bacterium]